MYDLRQTEVGQLNVENEFVFLQYFDIMTTGLCYALYSHFSQSAQQSFLFIGQYILYLTIYLIVKLPIQQSSMTVCQRYRRVSALSYIRKTQCQVRPKYCNCYTLQHTDSQLCVSLLNMTLIKYYLTHLLTDFLGICF